MKKLGAILCLIACSLLTYAEDYSAPATPKWLRDITRVAYTDLPNIQHLGDWPEKLIADCATAKVQLFFSRVHSGEGWDGLGWKSAFGEPDSKMKDLDGTREIVELCHKNGIRYAAYYWAQREPESLALSHPEWRCVNATGKKTRYFCVNTAYRDLVTSRIVELVQKENVDAVFFDMFHARSDECYCDTCKAAFKAQTGQEPPLKEDFDSILWQQWTDFKYRSIERAMLHFNRAIKAANPEAALVVNTWNAWVYRNGHNTRNSIRVAEVVDGLLEETGWYDTVDPSFFAFPALHNFMSWHLGGLCKDTRALMWSSPSFARTQPIKYPEANIRVMTILVNGSIPAQSIPGRDTMAKYMSDVAARDEYFKNDRLHPWCGLVVSEKTELWYGRDNPKDRYVKGVYGAFQAMLERHLPVSLVTDRDLELGRLDKCKVLFMPNCAAMSNKEMETVRQFVKNGGGLVATYETSMYDEHAKPRPNFGLADLFNAKTTNSFDTQRLNTSFEPTRIHRATLQLTPTHPWTAKPILRDVLNAQGATQPSGNLSYSLPLNSRMLLIDSPNNSRSSMRISTANADKKTGTIQHSSALGLVEQTYGKGRVIYIPYDISWTFFRFGQEHWARIMELALRDVAAEPPPAEVSAPSIVQAMTHTQGNRLVVHLLNDISSLGRSQNVLGESIYERREVIPMHDIKVTFRNKNLRRITMVPSNLDLKPTETSEGLQVTVPRLDVHCMIIAE